MGKKSKNPDKKATNKSSAVALPAAAVATAEAVQTSYPSDGPSSEELDCLQTSSDTLQTKLDQLTSLALANDRAGFVSQFVPLDLPPADSAAYLQDLTTAQEAEGQWANLASEIAALSAGKGVSKIEGDQVSNAVFFFEHPLLPGCDREVAFVCAPGTAEWRAEG